MKNLDSLTLKFFYEENADFLNGGVIQKIQMPKRREVLFYIRNQGQNKKLYINIDPKYPHLCFIENKEDYSLKIPKVPPMFCMQLRKYLEGAKILNCRLVPYDRILEFYFSVSDEFGIENFYILSIELMGKYSNIILYNKKTGLIIGSAHNVSKDKSSIREVFGGVKYIYPKKQEKSDILKTSFASFLEKKENIPENFYYFSKPYFEFVSGGIKNDEELFSTLQSSVHKKDNLKAFWGAEDKNFNEIIFSYFSKIVNSDVLNLLKNKLSKIATNKIKGFLKIIDEKIDIKKFETYKKSGDLIFQYIYLIKEGQKTVNFDGVEIKLDENLTPAQNAQKYYKLYSKLKSAKAVQEKRVQEALIQNKYYEEILFSIENAENLDILNEIEEEITFEKQEKKVKPKIQTLNYKGFEILIGKNNKQNDYLIKKLSSPEDIWFHAQNCPSSHVILKTKLEINDLPDEIILYAAKLVKENSPLKSSAKAGVIYTKRKFLKRPPDTPLGYVTYREEKEVII